MLDLMAYLRELNNIGIDMKELNTLLNIINDPAKYKAKVEALKKAEDDVDKKLALIEMSGQIEPMHKKAKKLFDEAMAANYAARNESELIKKETQDWVEKQRAQIGRELETVNSQIKSLKEGQKAMANDLVEREKAIKARESAADSKMQKAAELHKKAQKQLEEINRRKERLEAAIA